VNELWKTVPGYYNDGPAAQNSPRSVADAQNLFGVLKNENARNLSP
jgi:hypothetical protein